MPTPALARQLPDPARGGQRDILVALGLALLALAVFWPALNNGFVSYDDDAYVTGNAIVRQGLSGQGFAWAFSAFHAANWHPLTWLSHMLDCQLYGLDPRGHHLTSLGLHALNGALLFLILRRYTGALARSAAVALLFALHPLRVESVAWVAERKDLLAALFWLLALAAYHRYAERPGAGGYGLVLLFFGCGLLAKPMVVTLPLVLLLLDRWPLGRFGTVPPSRLVVEKVPLLCLALASGIITLIAQQRGAALATLAQVPLADRLANIPVAYLRYLGKLVWPERLAVFYPFAPIAGWAAAGALLLLVAISGLVLRARHRAPYLAVGWFWFLVTLLPVVGIVQAGLQSLADRYTYLPLIGPVIMVVWGLADLSRSWHWRRLVLGAATVTIAALLALASRRQVGYWRDSITLFSHAVQVAPGNYLALTNLGYAYSQQGQSAEGDRYLREALRANPRYAPAHYNLGVSRQEEGKLAEAEAHFAEAVRVQPSFAEAHFNRGIVLGRQGRIAEAIAALAEAVRLRPDWSEARRTLAGAQRLLAEENPGAAGGRNGK